MADKYGALPLPTVAPTTPPDPQAAGDPLLGYVADFVRAVLIARATVAWQAVAPQSPVVRTVFLHDPDPEVFNEKHLPALFVFRKPEDIADQLEWTANDYRFDRSQLCIQWVLPTATQDKRAIRAPVMSALVKAIDQALERGRDPSWVVAGDADTQASTEGSVLARFAGWSALGVKSAMRKPLVIEMSDAPKRTYDALVITCDVEELLVTDLADFDQINCLDLSMVIPDQGTGLGDLDVGDGSYD